MRRTSPRHHTPPALHPGVPVVQAFAAILVAASTACAHVGPVLGEVFARVDVARVIECAGKPDNAAKARCLGVAVLTPAIDVALRRAAEASYRAIDQIEKPTGSEVDADPRAEHRAARELEAALDDLARALAEVPHD